MKTQNAFLKLSLLSLVAILLGASMAKATTYYSMTTGNWSSTSTWSTSSGGNAGTAVPGSSDIAMIERGYTVTVDVDNATCTTLDLGSTLSGNGAGTIAFNSGSQLTVSGTLYVGVDINRTGSINMANGGTLISTCLICNSLGTWTPGTGTVQLTYDHALPSTGFTTFNNLTINSGTTTMGAALTINGNLKVRNGAAFIAGAYALTVVGTTTVGDGTSGTLSISSATGTKTFTGAVTINAGGALTESAPATLSFGGDVTIGGTLTENGAAVVGFAGNLQNNGTYAASTGLHTFAGATKTMSGTSAIAIPAVAVTGTCQNNGTSAVTNALSGSGGLTQGPNSKLLIGGLTTSAITITTLNASANANTINYTGDAQTVKPTTYYNLTFSGSGAKTMTGTTISGTLDFEGTATATFTDTPTASSLTFRGVTQATGTWGNIGSGATHIDSQHFAGTGVLSVGSTPTSSTALASSLNPSTYGSPVTFTATVTGSGPTPSGTVTFKEGGTTLGSGTLNGSGAATLVISTLSVAGSPHSVTAVYGGDGNFAGSTSSAVVQAVNRANPSVTAWPTASAITYGHTLADSTLSGGSATPTGSFAFTTPSTAPSAGTASQSVTYTPTDTANYNTASSTVSVTVNARAVNLTGTRPYDGTATAAAGILSVANRVGSDDVTAASGSGALSSKDVGSRTIASAGTLALGGTTAGNYTLTGAGGSVTISPAALAITANDDTKMYGDSKTCGAGSTAFTTSGLPPGETIGSVTITASGGTADTAPVGNYPLTASGATGGAFSADNYQITYTPGTLHVLPRLSGSLASASLSGYKGDTIKVLFVAKDAAGNATGTNDVQLAKANGGSSFTYAIGVPPNTATVSLKPRFYLRKKFAVPATIATANQVTLDLTGTFVGGDADGNNQVDGNDYAWIRALWGKTSNTQYDVNGDGKVDADDFPNLNGDGVIDALDYAVLKGGWYHKGDDE